jgi:hypothetical protein
MALAKPRSLARAYCQATLSNGLTLAAPCYWIGARPRSTPNTIRRASMAENLLSKCARPLYRRAMLRLLHYLKGYLLETELCKLSDTLRTIDGTTYKVKFDRDPLELAKLARKPYKQKKAERYTQISDVYGRHHVNGRIYTRFDNLNCLQALDYHGASAETAAQYDSSIPLFEVLNTNE